MIHPDETRLRNLRQLTFGGQNAEGYWSADGKSIVYQGMNEAEGVMCDQQYVVDVATGKSRMVSSGKGRVTCGYFYDGDRRVLYASTHLADPACPPPVDHSKGYAWPMTAGYDIVSHALDGSGLRAPHRDPRLRRRGRPSRRTGRRSSSPPSATATSRSTRWRPTGRT